MSSVVFTKADLIAGKEILLWDNSNNKRDNWQKMDFRKDFTATNIPIAFCCPTTIETINKAYSDYRLNNLMLNGSINDIRVEYKDDVAYLFGVPNLTDRMKGFLGDVVDDDANMLFRLCAFSVDGNNGKHNVTDIISFVITMC